MPITVTDVIQLFNSNGRLGMVVYSPDDDRRYRESFFSNNMGQGPGALTWLSGNSGGADIIQPFDSNGRLGLIVYSADVQGRYSVSFSSGDMGQGTPAIAWLTGSRPATGKSDVFQLFNSNGRLGMIVYSPDAGGRYAVSFSSGDMGHEAEAIAWLASDTTGSGKTDIIQLFDSNGRLGMVVYSPDNQGRYRESFFSTDMGQGPGALAWLVGDTSGSGKTDIIQLFNNNGRLGMIVYSSLPQGGYGVSFSRGDMGERADAITWLANKRPVSSTTDIIQLFNSNGRLGMAVYSSDNEGRYTESFFSNNLGQGPDAIAWLTGQFRGTENPEILESNIIQLFNNNGRLGMIVYSSLPQGGYGVSFSSGDMGHNADAIDWLGESHTFAIP